MAPLTPVILAGGAGTRLREQVPALPKPVAPVGGRPFLAYLLERLVTAGFERIVIAVGYGAETVMRTLGTRFAGAQLEYAVETVPLGTGGALLHALTAARLPAALALNGDTLLDVDYPRLLAWYDQCPEPLAMVLRRVPDAARFGGIELAGERVAGFAEKRRPGPGLINAGVYVVQAGLFPQFGLRGSFSLETDLLESHCASLRPRAFVTDAYFVDIGTPDDYRRAERELPTLSARGSRGG